MPYPAKLVNLSALLAKLEATYATAIAVTSTADGHLLALSDRYNWPFTPDYLYDGVVGPAPGNLSMLKRVPVIGRTVSGDIPMRAKGAAATYAATVLPNIHTMLKISGLDSTLSSGNMTYTPTADSVTYSSATMEAYKRGEKWSMRGCLASLGFDINTAGIPLWTFGMKGILDTAIADAAMVAPVYPTLTTAEPVATGMTLAIGSFTAVNIKSASFKMNRGLELRTDFTAADAIAGFVPTGYDPEFRVTLEQTALTSPTASGGFDPYKLRLLAEALAVNLVVGSTQFNRWKLNLPTCQLSDYSLNNEGPVATTELVFKPYNSSPIIQTDCFNVVFD